MANQKETLLRKIRNRMNNWQLFQENKTDFEAVLFQKAKKIALKLCKICKCMGMKGFTGRF